MLWPLDGPDVMQKLLWFLEIRKVVFEDLKPFVKAVCSQSHILDDIFSHTGSKVVLYTFGTS